MKNKLSKILIILLFILGFAILAYPTVSNQWNNYVQNKLIAGYSTSVEELSEEDYSEEWEKAESYNATITTNQLGFDVFGAATDEETEESTEYLSALNIDGDGIMGYLSIPKINIEYAIYHGTEEETLQTGLGHLTGTALPIGGTGTHSVIAGHRGLPSCKLLTDIDQLEIGDKFYIHVLGEVHAYEVDQILPMVEADDYEALTEALSIEPGKDYVTLFTCTPYGVNTHRLLVRGTRVEYLGEDETPTGAEAVVETAKDYYMIYLIAGILVTAIIIFILSRIFKKKAKKSLEETSEDKQA